MKGRRAVLPALILWLSLSACGGPCNRVTALGSSSMDGVMGILAEQYGLDHPDVVVSVEGGGSSAGVEAAITGDAHIGLSSRRLKGAERERGLVETIVALDGIAVIVSKDNPVDNLTAGQLADVYTGAVTNWAQVGGADVPIAPVGREAGSGTRDGFEQATGTQGRCVLTQELISTGAVVEAVRGNTAGGAIGYASLSAVEGQEGIKLVTIDGAACTEQAVLDGSYPVQRPFVLVTRQEGLTEPARSFFAWAVSPQAAQLIRRAGAVPTAQEGGERHGA